MSRFEHFRAHRLVFAQPVSSRGESVPVSSFQDVHANLQYSLAGDPLQRSPTLSTDGNHRARPNFDYLYKRQAIKHYTGRLDRSVVASNVEHSVHALMATTNSIIAALQMTVTWRTAVHQSAIVADAYGRHNRSLGFSLLPSQFNPQQLMNIAFDTGLIPHPNRDGFIYGANESRILQHVAGIFANELAGTGYYVANCPVCSKKFAGHGGRPNQRCAACFVDMTVCPVTGTDVAKTDVVKTIFGREISKAFLVRGGYHSQPLRKYVVVNTTSEEDAPSRIKWPVGVELELQVRQEHTPFCERVNGSLIAVAERDGSLGDGGVEIITGFGPHRTTAEHIRQLLSTKMFGTSGVHVDQRCGMHSTFSMHFDTSHYLRLLYLIMSRGSAANAWYDITGRGDSGYAKRPDMWRKHHAILVKCESALRKALPEHRSSIRSQIMTTLGAFSNHYTCLAIKNHAHAFRDPVRLEWRDCAGTADAEEAVARMQFFILMIQFCRESLTTRPTLQGMAQWLKHSPEYDTELPDGAALLHRVFNKEVDRVKALPERMKQPARPISTSMKEWIAIKNRTAISKIKHRGSAPSPYFTSTAQELTVTIDMARGASQTAARVYDTYVTNPERNTF